MSIAEKCSVEGCQSPGYTNSKGLIYYPKGYCGMHYQRMRRNDGDLGARRLSRAYTSRDGRSKHPLYNTLKGMMFRCYNPKHNAYKYYGAKGITVCDEWLGEDGFINFLRDVGDKPAPHYSIDRIDNTKGYTKDNVRWATHHQQAVNKTIAINPENVVYRRSTRFLLKTAYDKNG